MKHHLVTSVFYFSIRNIISIIIIIIIIIRIISILIFRHSFVSQAIASQKIDTKTLSAMVGHAHVSTTMDIYAHEIAEAQAKAMNVVADVILERQREINSENKDNE